MLQRYKWWILYVENIPRSEIDRVHHTPSNSPCMFSIVCLVFPNKLNVQNENALIVLSTVILSSKSRDLSVKIIDMKINIYSQTHITLYVINVPAEEPSVD